MANKALFKSSRGHLVPAADTHNEAGGPAYAFSPKHALAQYAVTGCLNHTYYASAEEQLDTLLRLAAQVDAEFVAKTAVYCREKGHMKDAPAVLCAALSVAGPQLLEKIFARVIDNGKMLRNFVQVMRSGAAARKSLGSLPKRLVRRWFETRRDDAVFCASVGQSPSLGDIVKMVHPKPADAAREALYGYLIGREIAREKLPELVRQYEAFKAGETRAVPDVPFQMLTALPLTADDWCDIARRASWQTTRMNLNTFARHGVFGAERPFIPAEQAARCGGAATDYAALIAARLRDPAEIARARAFPYQLLTAFHAAGDDVPAGVREALQDAMEIAVQNVPDFGGKVYVFPDVSGSMSSPATGHRKGATTATRCIDVAALVAAAVLRKNPDAEVIPFEQQVVSLRLNPRDSVMTNAARLARIGGGGTNCSAPLELLNNRKAAGDLAIYVSDNQSWVDANGYRGTETMRQWAAFKQRNPQAKLVCIDIQPYGTTQAAEREDVLNIGGFSDAVFEIVADFAASRLDAGHWVGVIEAVTL